MLPSPKSPLLPDDHLILVALDLAQPLMILFQVFWSLPAQAAHAVAGMILLIACPSVLLTSLIWSFMPSLKSPQKRGSRYVPSNISQTGQMTAHQLIGKRV